MVFVCGVLIDGDLLVIDSRFYNTASRAKKRCEMLNKADDDLRWSVLYQDNWKLYNDDSLNQIVN